MSGVDRLTTTLPTNLVKDIHRTSRASGPWVFLEIHGITNEVLSFVYSLPVKLGAQTLATIKAKHGEHLCRYGKILHPR